MSAERERSDEHEADASFLIADLDRSEVKAEAAEKVKGGSEHGVAIPPAGFNSLETIGGAGSTTGTSK